MALLADATQITDNAFLARIFALGNFRDTRSFLVAAGIAVILILTLSRLLGIVINYWRERFQWGVYNRLSQRLLRHYLNKPYRFFLSHNTADLRGYIFNEVSVVVNNCLGPVITLMISGGTALVIILLLLVISPVVALTSAAVLGGAYWLLYRLRKEPLVRLGQERLVASQARQRILEELLQGIKTVKTYGNEQSFVERYRRRTGTLARVNPKLQLIYRTPKLLLEILAFSGIIAITLILYLRTENIGDILPTLTLYAVASYRLLPALQDVFGAYAIMRANRSSLQALYPDLIASHAQSVPQAQPVSELPFRKDIRLENIHFRFPRAEKPLFTDLSLTLPRATKVAFVGETGSGKTTLVDLLTGLHTPTAGELKIDGTPLTTANLAAWQRQLAYVPQEVYLYDASLRENVIFGATAACSDEEIMEILDLVNLGAFVREEVAAGLDTELGENGIRLSGGQRQRIGLARALLRRPSVLVLDEATSALDTLTERSIIDAIERLPEELTVILIAHRLSTVRHADRIYLLEKGRIVAAGTYSELEYTNRRFREMAALTRE